MKYYTEISHIVRGAVGNDKKAVEAYTHQLINKLTADGEFIAVKGLSESLNPTDSANVFHTTNVSMFSKPVPVEKDNRFALADKTYPTLENSVVFLSAGVESIVEDFLGYLFKKDKLMSLGIPINPTLLLHGQPGTGKSKLANYIAARLELPLVTARADALISSYLGSTSKNIRALLEYAQSEPCVLFLDEFDAIAKARDDKNEIGELKRVVVSLLQNIDNLGDTILVAATNHVHLLDPAIGRRFHYKLELSIPQETERSKLLSSLLMKFGFTEEDISICVAASDGMTGAEIEMATFEYLRRSVIQEDTLSQIGLLKELLLVKYQWLNFGGDEPKLTLIQELKKVGGELFTGKLLAQLWGVSPSYISRILKENK